MKGKGEKKENKFNLVLNLENIRVFLEELIVVEDVIMTGIDPSALERMILGTALTIWGDICG